MLPTGPVQADLGLVLSRSARRFGPKAALVTGGRTLTYADLSSLRTCPAQDIDRQDHAPATEDA